MKIKRANSQSHWTTIKAFILMGLVSLVVMDVSAISEDQQTSVPQYSGTVFDSGSKEPLVFSTVAVEGTHIATVSNSEGKFILKVPQQHTNKNLVVSFIGYEKKTIPLSSLKPDGNNIELDMTTVSLVEVSVFPSDPDLLIRAVMNRRDQNYLDVPASKTAFYRETIKKGWSYVSLTEAVVDIYKHPYSSSRTDLAKLIIGRKSTDYGKIDTLVFRLQGGPVSALMLDIMKDPYTLFDEEMVGFYSFEMSNITRVDDRMLYVLSFKQKANVSTPLFYGKLYVDTETLAITSASFNMNISNRSEAARMFIRRKPLGARVFPTETAYMINYREQDGKWFFSYARAEISFRVNWRRKLFNTNYHTTMEMAITDWEVTEDRPYRPSDRLKMNVIMEDAVEGFADPGFWGDYNVIEPEQPIENAIRKIQKGLEK
jgi:sporulation protein YlmC with PRC-barrel domain